MGDVDQDEIDLDEEENTNEKDIARFVYLIRWRINQKCLFSSTVQRVHRTDQAEEEEDDDDDRPFTLTNGDEVSDEDQFDSNEHESARNQHIHENFKVDNERGKRRCFAMFDTNASIGFRNETDQMGIGS